MLLLRHLFEKLLLLPASHLPCGHAALFPQLLQKAPPPCCATASVRLAGGAAQSTPGSQCRAHGRAQHGLPPPTRHGGFVLVYFGQAVPHSDLVSAPFVCIFSDPRLDLP